MKLKVFKQDGTTTKKSVALDEAVFAVEPNDHAIWLDVRRIQANGRQGTHKSKERGEVAGSTRKLYRQKGTGNARAGSAKSPIRKSGGTIFGPRPRNYTFKINRKTQLVARRSALTYKAKEKNILVVEGFDMDAPNTKSFAQVLANLKVADSRTLFVVPNHNENVYLSSRNLPKAEVLEAANLNTYAILKAKNLVLVEGAASKIEETLSK